MQHHLEETVSLLACTPAVLDALLRGQPEIWTLRNEGAETWSAFEVLAHLIHAEGTAWMPRVRTLLQFGESRELEPLDRWDRWQSAGRPLRQLLDDFARMRAASLEELRALHLRPQDMARPGRHSSLGSVTLSELLATWATHDLTHLHQISRVMAHQYSNAVGPWSRYLGVLHCDGHSAEG
jgi:hypothetical protein